MGSGGGSVGWGGGVDIKFWTFSGGGVTKIEQVRTMGEGGGSKVWSFCENIITECSLCRGQIFLGHQQENCLCFQYSIKVLPIIPFYLAIYDSA